MDRYQIKTERAPKNFEWMSFPEIGLTRKTEISEKILSLSGFANMINNPRVYLKKEKSYIS